MSDLCGTVAGMVTAKESMSTERERERHSKFLFYLTGAR
jgi:predicted nucleic acid-binding Zn ribbon protein